MAKSDQSHLDHPVYWFAILERARERGDRNSATSAMRELKRLGVDVKYSQNPEAVSV